MFAFPGFFHRRWAHASCGEPRWARAYAEMSMPGGEYGGGASLGVRRPLRLLAWKLALDDKQVAEVAKALADIKTERAQADVDARRAATMLADLAGAAEFDQAKAKEAADLRVRSAERIRDALVQMLARLHTVLSPEQREKLAYLIRTGALQL